MRGISGRFQPGFSRMLLASFLLHVIILTSGIFLAKGEKRKIFFVPTYTTVEIVESPGGKAGPAPERALIEKTRPERTAALKKETAAKIEKPKGTARPETPKTIEKKTRRTEEKLLVEKTIAAIRKRETRREEEELVSQRIKGIRERLKEEESAGGRAKKAREGVSAPESVSVETPRRTGAAGGVTREFLDVEFKQYYNAVGTKIQSLWVYPGESAGDLQTVLSLNLLRSGEVKSVRVEKASGNALFDESAIKAIKKASPFPPLPGEMKGDSIEIGVRFCPEGCER